VFAENLAGEEDALKVDIQDPVPFLFGDVEERGGGVDAGGVDQNVYFSEFLKDSGESAVQIFPAGRIALDADRFRSHGRDGFRAGVCIFLCTAGNRYRSAGLCEALRHRSG
jgi:hypothetical protein